MVNAGSKLLAADAAGSEEKARHKSLLISLIREYAWREKPLETPGMTLAQLIKDVKFHEQQRLIFYAAISWSYHLTYGRHFLRIP